MKQIVAAVVFGILATIFLIQKTDANRWCSVKMKTNIYTRRGGYINIPYTTYDPEIKNYVKVHPGRNYTYEIDFYCQRKDPRVCIMFDKCGNMAGMQMSFLKKDFQDVSPTDYNITEVKGFEETNFFGIPAYSVRVYFTNPCFLSGSCRMNTNEVAEGLWINIYGKWVELERCQPNGPQFGDFYLQGCYPKLGTIYVYKFNKCTYCKDAFLFYVSYHDKSLAEFGMMMVGRGGSPGPKNDWYAHPTGKPLEKLLPSPPPCFEILKKYGFTSLQVYLIDNPDKIRCPRCKS